MSKNIIKPLFRKWLKRKIAKTIHCKQLSNAKQKFEWIYNSPLSTWRNKLLAINTDEFDAKRYSDWLAS